MWNRRTEMMAAYERLSNAFDVASLPFVVSQGYDVNGNICVKIGNLQSIYLTSPEMVDGYIAGLTELPCPVLAESKQVACDHCERVLAPAPGLCQECEERFKIELTGDIARDTPPSGPAVLAQGDAMYRRRLQQAGSHRGSRA